MPERPSRPRPRGTRPGQRPVGGRPPRVDVTRLAAHEVLTTVRTQDAYTNLVLPAVLRKHGLAGRDAGFVTELASGTIRRRSTYDAVIGACSARGLRALDPPVLDALRLGTHQLLSMRVPAHAALSTTVDLVRHVANQGAAGFANAVLRKVASRDLDDWLQELAPAREADPVAHDALVHAHPAWVVAELRKALHASHPDDDVSDLLAADNVAPGVTLVARPGLSTREELPGEPTPYSPHGVHLDGGDPGAVEAVAQRRAGVQDEGSQLVATALAGADLDGRDERWLDLCSGPGGKSALLAALAAGSGAVLTAHERQLHRAGLVRRNLALADGTAVPGAGAVVVGDGTRPAFAPGSLDRVLVDAPCTGLGALRRRPEARWRRRAEDLLELVMLQRRLLAASLDLVRPGGLVLYATCSPVLSETADVVESALAQRRDVSLVDLGPAFAHVPGSRGPLEGTVQLWPHRHGTDAMFLALLRRD
ncbi:RsmB/NOP family class I SAM-dependent RNA methyltransferase [Nocardioides bruguierae]|uniref:RsmB/NOP family class I SAM-dependent RNA methyltransferase n=1 Tax=Nocardioides bruguierae TaxID=2945102 RepID=UPI00202062C0|nr:transcription antitermination factor NusB [Nocardioides bruguierae]MCL8024286.1 rRNA cytosine-C5-methyltransferase [Nocardioides bruguierae]